MPLMSPTTPPAHKPTITATQAGIASFENEAARDGGQAHDRADREVDAAGRDHRSHAERHDANEGEIARGVIEILGRGEGLRLQPAHHDADDDERDRHPERLRTREALPEIVLLDVQHRFDRDVGLRRFAAIGKLLKPCGWRQ